MAKKATAGTTGKATTKAPAAKTAAKTTGKTTTSKATKAEGTKRTPNAAFMKPMTIASPLQPIVGNQPLPRTEVTKRVWDYIKKNKLQDPKEKRKINADANLQKVFGGKKTVDMFEMTRLINGHLS